MGIRAHIYSYIFDICMMQHYFVHYVVAYSQMQILFGTDSTLYLGGGEFVFLKMNKIRQVFNHLHFILQLCELNTFQLLNVFINLTFLNLPY